MLQVIPHLPQPAPRPWGHVVAVLLLLLTQLLARQIVAGYYNLFLRPYLIEHGATPCGPFAGTFTDRCGEQCDLGVIRVTAATIEQRFYGVGGATSITVRTIEGKGVDDSVHYWSRMADSALPFMATGLLLVAVLRKMARTGSLFTFHLARHK